MALRDLWRGGRRDRERDEDRNYEHVRYPLDPLSRDSWRDEAEARYGSQFYREADDERRQFNDRWENSYSGPGYGRAGSSDWQEHRGNEYGGSSSNPFYGDHPLMRAGSDYSDTSYFGSKAGLPMTQWRQDADQQNYDELVYGGRSMDAGSVGQVRGRFRGQGPRGYKRSDERIKEDVCQCLTDDEHIDASNIDVAVNDREVVLSGTVTSRMQKRHAEDLIERLPGVRDVINSIKVVSDTQSTQSSTGQSTSQSTYLSGTRR